MFQFHYGLNGFFFFESDENYITIYKLPQWAKAFYFQPIAKYIQSPKYY